jgi:hypothetical protein
MATALQPIGKLVFADKAGILPRLGRFPEGPWPRILEGLLEQIRDVHCGQLASVILRGSVARGTAIFENADVDLIVVTHGPDVLPHQLRCHQHPDLSIEVVQCEYHRLLADPVYAWLRFTTAFSGVVLEGADLIAELPPPRLGTDAIAHLDGVERWSSGWAQMFAVADSDDERRQLCRWVMKRSVRAAFESVMFRINAYSRDLYPCAKAVAREIPSLDKVIWQAASLAIAPVAERTLVAGVLEEITPALRAAWQEMKAARPASEEGHR